MGLQLPNTELIVLYIEISRKIADMSEEVKSCSMGKDGKGNFGIIYWPIVEEIGTQSNFQGDSQREEKANLVFQKHTEPASFLLVQLMSQCQHFAISRKGENKHFV